MGPHIFPHFVGDPISDDALQVLLIPVLETLLEKLSPCLDFRLGFVRLFQELVDDDILPRLLEPVHVIPVFLRFWPGDHHRINYKLFA